MKGRDDMKALKVKIDHVAEPNRFGYRIKSGYCPHCGEYLQSHLYPKCCGYCGQKIIWENKEGLMV